MQGNDHYPWSPGFSFAIMTCIKMTSFNYLYTSEKMSSFLTEQMLPGYKIKTDLSIGQLQIIVDNNC